MINLDRLFNKTWKRIAVALVGMTLGSFLAWFFEAPKPFHYVSWVWYGMASGSMIRWVSAEPKNTCPHGCSHVYPDVCFDPECPRGTEGLK